MSELLLQPSRGVCWWAVSTDVPLSQRLRWLVASISRHFREADGLADSAAVRQLPTHFETISKELDPTPTKETAPNDLADGERQGVPTFRHWS
ncbi:hypothetical protein AB0I10_38215 [Streptomyces sp. NPDC050636]|uniref:hypothetical protein n=1 Tax=Streptomyces sp. NPDC050636 TaxID=3154510 RepID=UPI00343AC2CC